MQARTAGKVVRLLAVCQHRTQALLALDPAGKLATHGSGDGWMRLMTVDLDTATLTLRIRTYSIHAKAYAGDQPTYAAWYGAPERH